MTVPTTPVIIDQPGVYDLDEVTYHADPVPGGSLSSSGARRLLPPKGCPALFAYEREHGRPPKREFDFGHAAHRMVLGAGLELVVVDADDWRTKAAREARAAAYADGAVPLLTADMDKVEAMAAALRAHPVASTLFDTARGGRPEQSLFWPDERTGVWRRARLDWYPVSGRRLIVPDYKTCISAAPDAIQRAAHDHGYALQADWYLEGTKALGLAGDAEPVFVFVFQEKSAPYLVTVVQMHPVAMRYARDKNRQAIDVYRECTRTDRWPGYSDAIEEISLPSWVEHQYLEGQL